MSGQITLNDAIQQHQAGNLDLAARMYRDILDQQPHHADALHLLGLTEHQQGRHAAAESLIRQALAVAPATVEFYESLASVLITTSQFDQAAEVYRGALQVRPDSIELLNNLAEVELRRGRADEAVANFSAALQLAPGHPDLLNNLGNALRESGRAADAEVHLRHAFAVRDNDPLVAFNLALTLIDLFRFDEAADCFRHAIALAPEDAELHRSLAEALRRGHCLQDAAAAAQRAVQLNAADARTHATLGAVQTDIGRFDLAEACFRQAMTLDRDLTVARVNLAEVYRRTDRLTEAEELCRDTLSRHPDDVQGLTVLGKVLRRSGRLSDAESTLRRVVGLDADNAEAHGLLALVLTDQARIDEALSAGEAAQQINPDDVTMSSDQLLCLQYLPGITAARLAEEHARWNERFGSPPQAESKPHPQSSDANRPLRVGLVSGDFARHPVGQLIVRGLEELRKSDIHFVCYANQYRRDDMTDRIRAAVPEWRDVWPLTDAELSGQIHADGIDILIDLAGHTGGNRLPVFARRPAPVQATWLGYAGTAGLSSIDWLITDEHHLPPELARHCTEQVVRLPGPHICFEPPAEAPAVGPLPADTNGFITFGCFNNPAKLNADVIAFQAELLNRLPDARLILKYRGLDDPSVRQRLTTMFLNHGVDPERLELRGRSPFAEMLDEYNEVDIALDTFPFNGGMTTLLSLWMGVPVVTHWGQTFAGRQTASFVTHMGLTELVAENAAETVQIVDQLARDPGRLRDLRHGLRDRMTGSPLCHAPQFADRLRQTLRKLRPESC